MTAIAPDRIELTDDAATLLTQASRLMSESLDRPHAGRIAIVEEQGAAGKEVARLEIPPSTLKVLARVLASMARQQTFTLYPELSELTTKQAAEFLGVSRPHLIKVLEEGKIPFRKVGRHRRIFSKDVVVFKDAMRIERKAAMDAMVKATEEADAYDL